MGVKEKKREDEAWLTGKDMPVFSDGSTYHLGVKPGDVFPRIITVGHHSRAESIATLFDKDKPVVVVPSTRQFGVLSGYYKNVGVSIISVGMGSQCIDFMLREATYVQPGPMAIIRLGTCGLINKNLKPGTVVTAGKGAMFVSVNYAHLNGCLNSEMAADSPSYLITKPVMGDAGLNNLLLQKLENDGIQTYDGLDACCETFYSCQGRYDPNFNDQNDHLLKLLVSHGADFIEMENHQLFHLAAARRTRCHAAAAAIGILNRTNDAEMEHNISIDVLHEMEKKAGNSCLQALVEFDLQLPRAS